MKLKELGFESIQQYSFPNIVNVCVIRGKCPCKCVHCPVGLTGITERQIKFGKSVISLQLFKKIVQEMSQFNHSTLRIHGVGEPILWEKLLPAIRFASNCNVKTWLFTCLFTEDKILLGGIVENCDIIEVSVNSFDKENYKKTKGVDAFSSVKRNIEFLRDTAKSKNLSNRIVVSRVESEDKQYDIDFVRYWKNSGIVDDAFIRTYHNYNNLLKSKFNKKIPEIVPCLVHWSRFNIDCNGTVILCFNEFFKGITLDDSIVLGDIEKQSISNIWHCEKLNLIRRAQIEKDYSIVEFADKLPCIHCTSCQPTWKKGLVTSENQIKLLTKRWKL